MCGEGKIAGKMEKGKKGGAWGGVRGRKEGDWERRGQ